MMRKFQILIPILILIALFFLYSIVQAASPCLQTTNPRADGLISTPDISSSVNKFGNATGACVIGQKAAFSDIPTYANLKSKYYDQAKSTSSTFTKHPERTTQEDADESYIDLTDYTKNHLYSIKANLVKRSGLGFPQDPDPAKKPAGVVFVEGDFTIESNSNIGYTGGLVFVVNGDIIIDPSITQINAVLISSGTIYTAGAGCSTSGVTASQLTIYGSLISLDQNKPIQFCRTLGASDATTPAEVINQEPKYLVLLRDLFSETTQRWSELDTAPTPAPTPTAAPTPTSPPVNLLLNPGFENQLNDWSICTGEGGGSCLVDSFNKYSGSYSARVSHAGGGWGWQVAQGNISSVSLGEQLCLSAMVQKQLGDQAYIAIQEAGPATLWREASLGVPDISSWQQVKGTVSVGNDWSLPIQVYLRVLRNISNMSGFAYFDDVSLTKGVCP